MILHLGRLTTSQQMTYMFDFLFTSHNSLLVVVIVSGERFLAGDVTHIRTANNDLSWEQHVVCHVSRP